MEVFAVYPGRYHPFHKGHASSFNQLADKFGIEKTLLAISGKQEPPKSPFSVGDRAKMAIACGIPKENIISVAQPYKAEEYIKYLEDRGLDPQNFALVFGVSKKDMEGVPEMGIPPDPRFTFKPKRDGSPAYLQPYSDNQNDLKNMLQHAYVYSTDVEEFPIAGQTLRDASAIRSAYRSGDEKTRHQILHDMYGHKAAKHLKRVFDTALLSSETLGEFYGRVKPLLAEASIAKRMEVLKRLLERKRKRSGRRGGRRGLKLGRSITTGWWGGLGNDSGEGGGDGGGMAEDGVSEIKYSNSISDSSRIVSSLNPQKSTKLGVVDHRTVYRLDASDCFVYYLYDADKKIPLAYIITEKTADGDYYPFRQAEKLVDTPGVAMALLQFLRHRGIKLVVRSDEPMTLKGITWLTKMIQTPRGLKIHHGNGESVNLKELWDEWYKSQEDYEHRGKMSIYIESNNNTTKSDYCFEDQSNKDGLMKNPLRYIGDVELDYDDSARLYEFKSKSDIAEASSAAQQAAIAINMKRAGKKPKKVDEAVVDYLDETTK